ncbi:hypothetical protein RSAG8_07889, partial [Rhizoctonia solani AG-8 WAC10335]
MPLTLLLGLFSRFLMKLGHKLIERILLSHFTILYSTRSTSQMSRMEGLKHHNSNAFCLVLLGLMPTLILILSSSL